MVSQSQQVVLIIFLVVSFRQHMAVGKLLPVLLDFLFQQPGKGIEPAESAHQFAGEHIYRMPLSGMCLLVSQYFVQFLPVICIGTYEYPSEERERSFAFRQGMDADAIQPTFRIAVYQPPDGKEWHYDVST